MQMSGSNRLLNSFSFVCPLSACLFAFNLEVKVNKNCLESFDDHLRHLSPHQIDSIHFSTSHTLAHAGFKFESKFDSDDFTFVDDSHQSTVVSISILSRSISTRCASSILCADGHMAERRQNRSDCHTAEKCCQTQRTSGHAEWYFSVFVSDAVRIHWF